MKIKSIHARQILDSRGNPTIEADVILENGIMGRAAVPSGASTGTHEAIELRDEDQRVYNGKGVLKAVANVNDVIMNKLIGQEVTEQEKIDKLMIDMDGTENKSKLGANAILAVSLATAHAGGLAQQEPLFAYIHKIAKSEKEIVLPIPMMNLINGGKHAAGSTDLQEYMIFPIGAKTFSHALQMGAEVFHSLAKILNTKGYRTTVGDEGGFAPEVKNGNKEPFDLLAQAIEKAGYEVGKDIVFCLDAAASEFYSNGKYLLKTENKELTTDEMIEWLVNLTQSYPFVSLEDCLDQEDWDGWIKLTNKLGNSKQIVGDDLFVTNTSFLQKGIEKKAANAILIKVNQIGTITETIKAVQLAQKNNWNAIISHRSGETEDTTIAHLAVGLGTGQIKTGSLSRTDRVAKYNELLRIEELLEDKAVFARYPLWHT